MPRTRIQSAREERPRAAHRRRRAAAALPLGEVELIGAHLGPNPFGPPVVVVGTHPAHVLMSRPRRLAFRVPENAGIRA